MLPRSNRIGEATKGERNIKNYKKDIKVQQEFNLNTKDIN